MISHLPGIRLPARNASTYKETFLLFITEEILQIIVDKTNEYIQTVRDKFSRERDALDTNLAKLKACLAILIMFGMYRASHVSYLDMFNTDGTGIEFVPMCMSAKRFLFLLRCLRFDSLSTRTVRRATDRMPHIRKKFDLFVRQCKVNYSPGEYLTIDEMLIPFRGRCSFKQYIPNKPAKYGLKIYSIADARTFYTYNLELYVGKQPEGEFATSNSPTDVVKRLVEPIRGTNRNITCDNWYKSVPLAQDLFKNYSLTLVGTMRKSRREISPEFLSNKRREAKSSVFGFCDNMLLVSYVPKKYRSVSLLSTMHSSADIDKASGDDKKPEVITFYNVTKAAVDVVDQLCATYSCQRRTRRWPLAVFFALINIAGINSYVLYNYYKSPVNKVKRHIFLRQLAMDLASEQMNAK
jgi:hypothetical protein